LLVQVIQIFFKAPIAGKVKTRLIPNIGVEASVEVHKRLCDGVIDTVMTFAETARQKNSDIALQVEFWTDLDINHPYIQGKAAQYGVSVYQQHGKDLGQKMCFSMAQGLCSADQVLVVGGDCFSLTEDYLQSAFDTLSSKDTVFGPADDGGYILIGATSMSMGLLDNIRWGESTVLAASMDRVKSFDKSVGLLDMRWDIDTWGDIQRHAPELLEGL